MSGDVIWTPGMTLEELEKFTIKKAMRYYNNNKTIVAQTLGIAIRTLDNRLEKYQQEDEAKRPLVGSLPQQRRF